MQALYTMIQINIKPCGMSVPVIVRTVSKLERFAWFPGETEDG